MKMELNFRRLLKFPFTALAHWLEFCEEFVCALADISVLPAPLTAVFEADGLLQAVKPHIISINAPLKTK